MLCLIAQLCLTFCDPMDCSPPGSSVHGDSSGKNTGVGCHSLLQGIFPTACITGRFFTIRATRGALEYISWNELLTNRIRTLGFTYICLFFSLNEKFFKFYSPLQFSKVSLMILYNPIITLLCHPTTLHSPSLFLLPTVTTRLFSYLWVCFFLFYSLICFIFRFHIYIYIYIYNFFKWMISSNA